MAPPELASGVRVRVKGRPRRTGDGKWVTLVPVEADDGRVWRYDVRSGNLLQRREDRTEE